MPAPVPRGLPGDAASGCSWAKAVGSCGYLGSRWRPGPCIGLCDQWRRGAQPTDQCWPPIQQRCCGIEEAEVSRRGRVYASFEG